MDNTSGLSGLRDHLYCHPNENSFINQSSTMEFLSVIKQLKSMLLLHLDLIQEQSDQLLSKDKLIISLREENKKLKDTIKSFNNRIFSAAEIKIEKVDELPITLNAPVAEEMICEKKSITQKVHTTDTENVNGENNVQLISKNEIAESPAVVTVNHLESKEQVECETKPDVKLAACDDTEIDIKLEEIIQETEEAIKQDQEPPENDNKNVRKREHDEVGSEVNGSKQKYMKGVVMITDKHYVTRDWSSREIDMDIQQEIGKSAGSNFLTIEDVCLEIPSWHIVQNETEECEKSDELTEDVSDEVFNKRHFKFEVDERRRKKWDVQRIREQRNNEKLRRRHCKTELETEAAAVEATVTSFYPPADSVKFLQITDQLPVQAFGESIPFLQPAEFSLPWLGTKPADSAAQLVTTNHERSTIAIPTSVGSNSCSQSLSSGGLPGSLRCGKGTVNKRHQHKR